MPHTVHLPASIGFTPYLRHVQQQACVQAVRPARRPATGIVNLLKIAARRLSFEEI